MPRMLLLLFITLVLLPISIAYAATTVLDIQTKVVDIDIWYYPSDQFVCLVTKPDNVVSVSVNGTEFPLCSDYKSRTERPIVYDNLTDMPWQ